MMMMMMMVITMAHGIRSRSRNYLGPHDVIRRID